MKKLIFSAIAGAVIIFAWGSLSWMVLPWHMMTLNSFRNETSVTQVVLDNVSKDGMYMYPFCHNNNEQSTTDGATKNMEEKMKEGPFIFASIHQKGCKGGMGPQMGIGFLTQVLASLLVAWLLLQTKGLSYSKRVLFVTLFGLAAAIVGHIPYWNWWGFEIKYTLVTCADLVMGWILAGFAIAGIAKP